jgi:hypothetical protein
MWGMGLARRGLYTEKSNGSDHPELSLTLATLELIESTLLQECVHGATAHLLMAVPLDKLASCDAGSCTRPNFMVLCFRDHAML